MEDDLRFCSECGMENPALTSPESRQISAASPGVTDRGKNWANVPQPTQYSTPPTEASTTQSPLLMFGIISIVALLALLVGGGAVWLLKSPNGSSGSNMQTNYASPQAHSSEETPTRILSSPVVTDYQAVESKIINGQPIDATEISALSKIELQRLRNAVFARHGRPFETEELQRYFDSRAWYVRRSDYTDQVLTPVDKENVKLIAVAEKQAK